MAGPPMIAMGLHQRRVPGSEAAAVSTTDTSALALSAILQALLIVEAFAKLLLFQQAKHTHTPKFFAARLSSVKLACVGAHPYLGLFTVQFRLFQKKFINDKGLMGFSHQGTNPSAFAAPLSSTQDALSVAEVPLEPAVGRRGQGLRKASGTVVDSRPAEAPIKGEEQAALSGSVSLTLSTAGVSEEPNSLSEGAASFGALELSSWRNISGLATIRRAVAASAWFSAAHAYRSAVSVASALVPYVWSSKLTASVREASSASIATSRAAPVLSTALSCGECNVLKAEGEVCDTDPFFKSANKKPLDCVRCPHCSGVFRWQEAQRLPDMVGVDLCVQRSPPPPVQEAVSAGFSQRGFKKADGALQVARKRSPARPPQRQSVRKCSSVVEVPENISNSRAEAAGYSSDCRPPPIVKHRHPRWIRFLAKRLMCFHASEGRRVREQPQDSEAQGHATTRHRHVRRKPRSRAQPAKEPSLSREWRQRSEEVRPGLPVAAEADQDCTVSACADTRAAPLEHQSSCVVSKTTLRKGHQRSAAALPGSLSTPGSGYAPAASAGTCAESPEFSSCSSVAAIDHGSVESALSEKFANSQKPARELSGNCAQPAQQAVKVTACSEPGGHHAPQVNLWPLISLEALNMDRFSSRVAFDKLEQQRVRFNALNREHALPAAATAAWNRRGEMQQLSDLLVSASIRSMLALDCAMPCVHSHDGLQVWKGESGSGNFTCRATFLLPVEPRLYATFASDTELRCQWDKNVTEQHVVEQVDAGHDVCYVAFRRIATVYPRDLVTLRVKCRLPLRAKCVEAIGAPTESCTPFADSPELRDDADAEADLTAYSSMSCSIDHPDAPETYAAVICAIHECYACSVI
ncbi:hypothetical protein ACSSS7_006097 [Eimeria intestinalis]